MTTVYVIRDADIIVLWDNLLKKKYFGRFCYVCSICIKYFWLDIFNNVMILAN